MTRMTQNRQTSSYFSCGPLRKVKKMGFSDESYRAGRSDKVSRFTLGKISLQFPVIF